jgi:hypothetical protein
MTEAEQRDIETLARAAGLDLALAGFRDDVLAAAAQVQGQRRALVGGMAPGDEPWPPMRVETGP